MPIKFLILKIDNFPKYLINHSLDYYMLRHLDCVQQTMYICHVRHTKHYSE